MQVTKSFELVDFMVIISLSSNAPLRNKGSDEMLGLPRLLEAKDTPNSVGNSISVARVLRVAGKS
jgi:hypothetical protein